MKYFKTIFVLLVIVVCGIFLSGCAKKESEDGQNGEEATGEETEEDSSAGSEQEEEEEPVTADFSDFSDETQTVGEEMENVEYTLAEIVDEEMNGFHRFTFELESEEEELSEVEARLYSSGGYIRVLLSNVTSDESGIDYQSSRSIQKNGITRLYHDVTANEIEEVYNIGISADTIFYLSSDGLSVTLDVKYPGESEEESYSDSEDFISADIELENTNVEGDVKIVGYSWSVEGGAVKFIWETSAASGNPTPETVVNYFDDAIAVRFSDVISDSLLSGDDVFETDLALSVVRVVGSLDGDDHVYTFQLESESEYRIYREVSPNQVVIEIR